MHQDAMRTTVTIDDDLAAALKRSAQRSGKSFKAIVNEAIRRGLSTGEKPPSRRDRFRVLSAKRGFLPRVDPLKLNQLVDDLAVDGFLERPHGRNPDAHPRH